MPIYEYRCKECSKLFEQLVRSSASDGEATLACPECGSGDLSRLFSLFASRSGSAAAAPAGGPMPSGGGGCCGGSCGCH
jgi:putative FmdB family regulatory protein